MNNGDNLLVVSQCGGGTAEHYNRGRPHRARGLASPLATAGEPSPANPRDVRRRDLLGGLNHEYYGAAA